jgi:hypothetical protein
MQENMDAIDRRIASTASLLYAVESAIKDWKSSNTNETRAIESFKMWVANLFRQRRNTDACVTYRRLRSELTTLVDMKAQSKTRQFACQEDDKQRIVEIFERVNDAREPLMVRDSTLSRCSPHRYNAPQLTTGLRVHKITVTIDQKLNVRRFCPFST